MNELLITPEQVARDAFRTPDFITPEAVGEATILAAQQSYVRPVLGAALCAAMARGAYPELLADYVRPALALYVKMQMMPSLAVQAGGAGVAELNSRNLARASDTKLQNVLQRLRRDAHALMRRAVEHIESARAGAYPEYDPAQNILNRCSIDGGIVILKNDHGERG